VLDRAYFTIEKELSSKLSMNVTADLFTSKDADDKGNGLELRVKYAYLDYKLWGTSTKVGMVPTPSDSYDSAIWPYRVQGKHLLDGLGIMSSADLGLVNQGVIGGYMDDEYFKYGSKEFGGKWGGWMVGAYNGSGYDDMETNNNKVVSGLIYVRPLPQVPILKGFQLAYIGAYGKSSKNFDKKYGSPSDNPDWTINIAQASLVHPYFTIMGQYYSGKGAKNAVEENDREGYLAAAFVRVPKVEKLRIFSKFYTYDPNTDLHASPKIRRMNTGYMLPVSPMTGVR